MRLFQSVENTGVAQFLASLLLTIYAQQKLPEWTCVIQFHVLILFLDQLAKDPPYHWIKDMWCSAEFLNTCGRGCDSWMRLSKGTKLVFGSFFVVVFGSPHGNRLVAWVVPWHRRFVLFSLPEVKPDMLASATEHRRRLHASPLRNVVGCKLARLHGVALLARGSEYFLWCLFKFICKTCISTHAIAIWTFLSVKQKRKAWCEDHMFQQVVVVTQDVALSVERCEAPCVPLRACACVRVRVCVRDTECRDWGAVRQDEPPLLLCHYVVVIPHELLLSLAVNFAAAAAARRLPPCTAQVWPRILGLRLHVDYKRSTPRRINASDTASSDRTPLLGKWNFCVKQLQCVEIEPWSSRISIENCWIEEFWSFVRGPAGSVLALIQVSFEEPRAQALQLARRGGASWMGLPRCRTGRGCQVKSRSSSGQGNHLSFLSLCLTFHCLLREAAFLGLQHLGKSSHFYVLELRTKHRFWINFVRGSTRSIAGLLALKRERRATLTQPWTLSDIFAPSLSNVWEYEYIAVDIVWVRKNCAGRDLSSVWGKCRARSFSLRPDRMWNGPPGMAARDQSMGGQVLWPALRSAARATSIDEVVLTRCDDFFCAK